VLFTLLTTAKWQKVVLLVVRSIDVGLQLGTVHTVHARIHSELSTCRRG